MAMLKCKMCGGDMELSPDKTFGTCEYCGSTMTLPRISDEQRAARFNRGNHFRRLGEFDKALAVYENIVREDENDAEAHWCCALCRFGIEYVEDPSTYEYVPTCHRASFDSILEDVDYQAALEHSDGVTRRQYQRDAAKIAEVQRGILATVNQEEPFNVFLCYKETDEASGQRSRDSIDAQEIYFRLTEKGYRVFFARITLEDKAGAEYEPYIFAALQSAKVMIVLGEKPEHFSAVWVKNEWSRYLALMKKDRSRLLIPCYKNMDPYDLPEQLGVLQSYDMAKIGFLQDLIRGVGKVLEADKPKEKDSIRETVVREVIQQGAGGANLQAQLKRGQQALEDRDWAAADSFFDRALDLNAECAEAFFGKVLASAKCSNGDELVQQRINLPVTQSEKLIACEKDRDRIARALKLYLVPDYLNEREILAIFQRPDNKYESLTSAWKQRVRAETDFWERDKLIRRAAQYANGNLSVQLKAMRETLFASLHQSLEKSQQLDIDRKKEATERYKKEMELAESEAAKCKEKALNQRELDIKHEAELEAARKEEELHFLYLKYCRIQAKATTAKEYGSAAFGFENFCPGHADSIKRAEACREAEKRLKALEEQHRTMLMQEQDTLQQELSSLKSRFSGKHRQEIAARLEKIEAELKQM